MSRIGINTKSINDGQVGTSDLANSAVTSAKIASPLANLSVTSLTAGGLSYPTSDGTDGQFLTTDGSGTLSFSTGATGKTFTVTNSGSGAYSFTGSGTGESSANSNPTLYLTRGETYTFSLNASGHPFYIKTVNGTGTGNQYANGVSGQGTQVGNITFTVPMNAPKKLYYNCSLHGSMNGTIYIPSHKDIDASTFQTKSDSVTSNNALLSLIEDRMQVANVQPLLDNYLQVANSTGFTTQSTLDNYLQVANSTGFITQSTLDNYLQVSNAVSGTTNSFGTINIGGSTNLVANNSNTIFSVVGTGGISVAGYTANNTLTIDGSSISSGGGAAANASVNISSTAPSSPAAGDLWFDSDDLIMYVYYNDGSSSQWVKSNPSGVALPSSLNVITRGSSVTVSISNGSLPVVARSGTVNVDIN